MQTDSCLRAVRDNARRMIRSRATAMAVVVLGGLGGALGGLSTAAAGARVSARSSQQPVIAVEPFVSKLSAYAGVVVWSHWNPALRSYQLAARYRGRTTILRALPRVVPFDVDLGPDQRGRVVAVYSRCHAEEDVWIANTVRPLPPPIGCVLYRYDFATQRERRIGGIVGTGSFYLPTIWHNEIAYVRSRGRTSAGVYVQPLSAPRGHRIAAIPLGDGSGATPGPVGLDLRGSELAIAWARAASSQLDSEIRLDTFSATRELSSDVLDAESSDIRSTGFLGFPSLTAAGVSYGRADATSFFDDAFEQINAAGAGSESPAPHALRGESRDGATTYALYGPVPFPGVFSLCAPSGCTLRAFTGVPR
jgi:hypothetical protein